PLPVAEKGGMLTGRNREYHEALQASETTMFLTVPPNSAPLARLTLHRQIPVCRDPAMIRAELFSDIPAEGCFPSARSQTDIT
ncbi:MAG: hypothetical protein IJK98_10205, partial [Clostridia bacterium]|nr:hypothetical protein [Clostridia bacterium]